MSRQQRLQKELEEMARSPPSLCSAGPVGGNLTVWQASIIGPPMTPYQGGCFKLSIEFPTNYPNDAPICRFITKIYHMNINEAGGICLDILNENWNPAISIGKVLLAICKLLSDPNTDHTLNPEKCELYLRDRIAYSQNAQSWTALYAK